MNLPQVVPFALLSTTFVFAVVELGLTGHLVSYFSQGSKEYRYDPSRNGYTSQTVTVAVPPILAFILFNSVWTMLVSVATAIIPWVFRSKADTNAAFNKLITIGLLGLYFVTTVFWLASFADMAARLSYAAGKSDYVNAIIAFAVLTWFVVIPFGYHELYKDILTQGCFNQVPFLRLDARCCSRYLRSLEIRSSWL
ncbi:hypothetical protein BDV24DRAFT_123578 [Aspergillus arachidicola]|uniref:MARVEL domain-containing protein n=1 Tax=Aspergillus arachidicola TaxID=656916 RepID=A0A5N6YL67_9EURO|nr:hypothetical protein BDV24DRAFT_123578 [Aspergillus arachidicola]